MGSAHTAEVKAAPSDLMRAAPVRTPEIARAPPPASGRITGAGALQRRIGNRGVVALARNAEPAARLALSSPNDPAEREAVRVAAAVARSTDPGPVSPVAPAVQRQPLAAASGGRVPPPVAAAIDRSLTGGTALSSSLRAHMEPRLGAELGGVRLHADGQSAALGRQLNARAFTVGNHVYFGRGAFQPDRREGQELIAHELTHTIQQGGAAPAAVQRDLEDDARALLESLSPEGLVRLAIRTVAPSLTPMIEKGGFTEALAALASEAAEGVFAQLREPLDGLLGVGETISAALAPVIEAIQLAGKQIALNDCTPIRLAAERIEQTVLRLLTPVVDAVQPVIASIKEFLAALWERFKAPILDWIEAVIRPQWEALKTLAGYVKDAADWLWDKTEGVRDYYAELWSILADLLGIGDSADGQNGILQWVEAKLTDAWEAIKLELGPFATHLKSIGAAVAGLLVIFSPAGPMLSLGTAAVEVAKGIAWVAQNWGKGNIIVTARAYVEKTLLPPLIAALDTVSAQVAGIATAFADGLGSLAADLAKAVALLGDGAVAAVLGIAQWLSDQVRALATSVQAEVGSLKLWLTGAFDSLVAFLRRVMDFLGRVADVAIDIYGLPVLLAEAVWDAVPACIRDPVVDFLGKIVLGQVELFSELVKDDEAWKRTKEEVGRLVRLVFRDKNLLGAIKAAFHFVLRIFNLPPDLLAAVAAKAMAAWDAVAKAPLIFIKSTIRALGEGFRIIWANKIENLKKGLRGWLLGEIKDKNLVVPDDWANVGQVFDFVLSLLGLSVEHVFDLVEKRFPGSTQPLRDAIGKVRKVMDWVHRSIDVTKSPKENAEGMLKQAKDFGLTLLSAGVDWIISKVAAKVAEELVKAAGTAGFGAILTAAQSIYAALLTAKKWMRQILDMANRALDNVIDLVAGAVPKVGAVFAGLMQQAMPVVIGFLADQVGLGDVGRGLGKAIEKLRAEVDKAILWLIDKIAAGIRWLIGVGKKAVGAIKEWWKRRFSFRGADGLSHEVYFQGTETNAQLMVASRPRPMRSYLDDIISDDNVEASVRETAKEALGIYVDKILPISKKLADEREDAKLTEQINRLSRLLSKIVGVTAKDMPKKSLFSPEAPFKATIRELWKGNRKLGERAAGSTDAYTLLAGAGLTQAGGWWKRMHLISHQIGGPGTPNNWVMAPAAVNSGTVVRGFELDVEALVTGKSRENRHNVIWVRVHATDLHPAWKPKKGKGYGGSDFAKTISLGAGLHYPDPNKKWIEDTRRVINVTATIPPPSDELSALAPSVNKAGATQLVNTTEASAWFVREVLECREKGPFANSRDFAVRMIKHRAESNVKVTDEFKAGLEAFAKAALDEQITFKI